MQGVVGQGPFAVGGVFGEIEEREQVDGVARGGAGFGSDGGSGGIGLHAGLDACEGEAGEAGLGEAVPVAGVALGIGAEGAGGGFAVVPPGVAEEGLLKLVGGGGEIAQARERRAASLEAARWGRAMDHWPLRSP